MTSKIYQDDHQAKKISKLPMRVQLGTFGLTLSLPKMIYFLNYFFFYAFDKTSNPVLVISDHLVIRLEQT